MSLLAAIRMPVYVHIGRRHVILRPSKHKTRSRSSHLRERALRVLWLALLL